MPFEQDELGDTLWKARARHQWEHNLVSNGYPQIDGFQLTIFPPRGPYFEEEKPLELAITSAGVIGIAANPLSILLVQVIDGGDRGRWEIPAGGVESTDIDVWETARREALEETGLRFERENLIPVTYAKKGTKAGIQFLTFLDIRFPITETDSLGRRYCPPFPGSLTDEIGGMALEPLGIFLDQKRSLVTETRHPWAYRNMPSALMQKLAWLKASME